MFGYFKAMYVGTLPYPRKNELWAEVKANFTVAKGVTTTVKKKKVYKLPFLRVVYMMD